MAPNWRQASCMGTNHSEASRDRVSLRVPAGLRRAIERACANRPGKVSINTWITEAISEKLDREEASKHRRASNG